MKKQQLKKQTKTGDILMTVQNLKICARNQEGYENLYLNDVLQLQYCNFVNIANLQQSVNSNLTKQQDQHEGQSFLTQVSKGVNTLFLNNNLISKIQNFHPLADTLVTLNLSHNRITQFQGLKSLLNLVVLDLSNNLLRQIEAEQIKSLKRLNRLNLAANLFETSDSIRSIVELQQNLQTFNLSCNQSFNSQPQDLCQILSKMSQLKVLFFKQTLFVRMTSAYRKRIILSVQSLKFLDDRPITDDERLLARAWQKGGLKEQNEVRKQINVKKEKKNQKIYEQIQERQRIVDKKVDKIFEIKAKKQIEQLQTLKNLNQREKFQHFGLQQQSLLKVKIQQLEKYLEIFKNQCRLMDLDKQLGVNCDNLPKMLVEKRTPECIFLYNVEQSQLQSIRQKYYPDQQLPLKAVNYPQNTQIQWLDEYDQILRKIVKISYGNWQIIVPAFNLDVYEYDQQLGRKSKRFSQEELKQRLQQIKKRETKKQNNKEEYHVDVCQKQMINQLDCLD